MFRPPDAVEVLGDRAGEHHGRAGLGPGATAPRCQRHAQHYGQEEPDSRGEPEHEHREHGGRRRPESPSSSAWPPRPWPCSAPPCPSPSRLVAAGGDLDRAVFLDAVTRTDDESPLVQPHDTRFLAEEIEEPGAALVVLDAGASVIDSALDGDRDRQMRRGLEPISKLAADTGVAVVGIVHFGKRESADTGKLILGSIAWSQVARSVLAVARDEHTHQLVISSTKANLAPGDAVSLAVGLVPAVVETPDGITQVARVEWRGETAQRAEELLAVSPRERTGR
ncbi:AAA family ATPase [Pseudonocardia kujensis]|nr:AAA family ATPase [Pseudonocardia kujensis]MCE0765291.1 AAA family ATPase [Pseudonocardia kujensis]